MHFTNTIYLFLRFFIGFSQRSYLSSIGNCSDLTRRCIKWEITLNHFNLPKKSDMKKEKKSYVTLWESLKKLLKRQFYHMVLRPSSNIVVATSYIKPSYGLHSNGQRQKPLFTTLEENHFRAYCKSSNYFTSTFIA